jgi:hypothetical protein
MEEYCWGVNALKNAMKNVIQDLKRSKDAGMRKETDKTKK